MTDMSWAMGLAYSFTQNGARIQTSVVLLAPSQKPLQIPCGNILKNNKFPTTQS